MADPLDILTGTVRPSRDDWGSTLANIAQVVASIPERRARAAQQRMEQETQQLKLQSAQQSAADLQALDAAFQQPGGRESVLNRIPGHLRGKVAQQFAELDESDAKRRAAKEKAREAADDTIARGLTVVKHHDYDPLFAQGTISTLKGYYQDDPERLKELQLVEAALHENPTREHVKTIADAMIARSATQRKSESEAAKSDVDIAATEAQTALRAQELAGEKPIQPTDQARIDAENARAEAARAAQAASQTESARHNRATESAAAQRLNAEGASPDLTAEGLDAVALSFAKTGQLPPLGMGKKAAQLRTEIINRAAQMNPALDLASNRADYQANEGALKQLQKQREAIGAFENTAKKNIDTFLATAEKVVDTGSPLANKFVRGVSGSMLGSPNAAAYDAARQVAINEIAKITSNPTLAGQLSDTARKEVEAFNPAGATLKQSVAVMKLLKQDMQNRTDALDSQIDAIRGRIKGGKNAPVVEEWVRDASGKLVKKGS